MSVADIKEKLGDYAKDTRINLSNVLSEDNAKDLSQAQVSAVALASAYATKNQTLISAIANEVDLSDASIEAAKAAATIMGMNNIYYRFVHLVSDKEYGSMPANLRMQVIGNPGVDKVEFELTSLGVSAINGCGMCIDAHVNELTEAGLSKNGIQSAIRIAAVVNAAAQGLVIEQHA